MVFQFMEVFLEVLRMKEKILEFLEFMEENGAEVNYEYLIARWRKNGFSGEFEFGV